MNRRKKILLNAAAVSGMIFVGYMLAAHFLVATVRTVGVRPFLMAASPRDAYLILRGRREMDWHGVHIHVDSNFVLDPKDSTVTAREIVPHVPMLGNFVIFKVTGDSGSVRFARLRARCASMSDRCIVKGAVPAASGEVCLKFLGNPSKAYFGDFEFLICRLPIGIEARFGCSKPDCEKFEKITEDAFASARDIRENHDPSARDSTSR